MSSEQLPPFNLMRTPTGDISGIIFKEVIDNQDVTITVQTSIQSAQLNTSYPNCITFKHIIFEALERNNPFTLQTSYNSILLLTSGNMQQQALMDMVIETELYNSPSNISYLEDKFKNDLSIILREYLAHHFAGTVTPPLLPAYVMSRRASSSLVAETSLQQPTNRPFSPPPIR